MENENTILIVDDEVTNVDFIVNSLKDDYSFKVAYNGESALEILKKFPIDLILLDIQMPKLNGYEVAEFITSNDSFKDIPFIFLTAKSDKDSLIYGFELGAKDYITKPFNKKELQVRVKNHLTTYLYQKQILKQQNILIQQSRLSAMGEMVESLAHQWRQPLNAVNVLTQEIKLNYKMDMLDHDKMDELSGKIQYYLEDMSKVIDEFRTFFKPKKSKEKVDIKQVLEKSIGVIKPKLEDNNIKLNFKIENDLKEEKPFEMLALNNELMQAFLNILNNAVDAVLKSSKEDKEIKVILSREKENLLIKISDTGEGIKKDIMEKIFEPYFTTKENELQGAGLGLYITKNIIEGSLKGTIDVSNFHKGAMFKVVLPAA